MERIKAAIVNEEKPSVDIVRLISRYKHVATTRGKKTLNKYIHNHLDPLKEEIKKLFNLLQKTTIQENMPSITRLIETYPILVLSTHTFDYTPLHIAVDYRHTDLARILINAGSGVNDRTGFKHTPLYLAIVTKDTELAQALIDAGADLNDTDIEAPLHVAAMYGHSALINILIDAGADINLKDSIGDTPFHRVIRYAPPQYKMNSVKLLMRAKANVTEQNRYGETPLNFAMKWQQRSVVNLLLEAEEKA